MGASSKMDFYQTPIYLIVFNRLDALRQLVDWLESSGYKNIHIIDNASTYPPLLQYLKSSPHTVHNMERNYGHLVLWESGEFDDVIDHHNFVLSDCDILPVESCPPDVIARLAEILDRYPNFTKVGLCLRIDDIPDHYALKASVLEWEAPYWNHSLEGRALYEAAIDTTFAYYRPGIKPSDKRWWRSLRTAMPLAARHLPWYADTSRPTEEDLYYQSHLKEMSSQWSTTDPVLLKKQNIKLQNEILMLRKEIEILRAGEATYFRHLTRKKLIAICDWIGIGETLRKFKQRRLR